MLGRDRGPSLAALRRYFHGRGTPDRWYSGSDFDSFDGGGDDDAVRDTITSSDILALTFLSITKKLPDVALATMTTHTDEISTLLGNLPVDVAIHEAPWSTYAPGSDASDLWELLCRSGGKHLPTTASKLLARKRPHLIPVYDSRVSSLLGRPASPWACFWTWFHHEPARAAALEELRKEATGIDDISLLRCLDVILWMRATSDAGPEPIAEGVPASSQLPDRPTLTRQLSSSTREPGGGAAKSPPGGADSALTTLDRR